jgi:hypothetical protein
MQSLYGIPVKTVSYYKWIPDQVGDDKEPD